MNGSLEHCAWLLLALFGPADQQGSRQESWKSPLKHKVLLLLKKALTSSILLAPYQNSRN